MEKLIHFIIDGGVNYIVTLGTTGETPVLSREEKIDIIKFTEGVINNRVPMVVGIGGNNTAEVVKEIETFPLGNAAAILSASPNYNKPSQEGIYQHYKEIASHSSKPIILYNVPGRTCRNMSASTTIRLANDFENIIGDKNFNKINILKKSRFTDFPFNKLNLVRNNNSTTAYLYEIMIDENISSPKIKMMYMVLMYP